MSGTGTKTAFVISPIGSAGSPEHRRYRLALEYIIKKAFLSPDWDVIRADDEEAPDSISVRVVQRIIESDLIVAVLTDQNPNVFYELAIAHGHRRPVIHMIERGQTIPFDVSDQRAVFYDLADPESVYEAQRRLSLAANHLEHADDISKNPLSQFEAFSAVRAASATAQEGPAVIDILTSMSQSLSTLAQRISRLEKRASEVRRSRADIDHDLMRSLPSHERRLIDRELERIASDETMDPAGKERLIEALIMERDLMS